MEEALMIRVEARRTRLQETVKKAAEIVQLSSTTGVELKLVYKIQHQLKNDMERLHAEINAYVGASTSISHTLIKEITKEEIDAEELLAEIVSLEKSLQWTQEIQRAQTRDSDSKGSNFNNTKLPKLSLPKFNGEATQWFQFWDRFESSIHESDLSEAHKLSYLMGCLEGPALDKLVGLSTTNINYNIAIDTLKRRYGNKRQLIDSHYDALFKLKRCSKSAPECRKTLDAIEKNMRILKELGENIEGNQFRVNIMDKFPENIIYQVNLQISDDDNTPKVLLTLDRVIMALEKTVTEEDISTSSSAPNIDTGTTAALHVVNNPRYKTKNEKKDNSVQAKRNAPTNKRNNFKRKAEEKPAGPASKKPRAPCIFCEGDHYNDTCTKVKSISERKRKLVQRCYNCFRKGHNTKDCRIKMKCAHCEQPHNRALCPKKLPVAASVGNSTTKIIVEKESTTTASNNNCVTTSYLQTATVKVSTRDASTTKQCRVLLDCGSQRSYIISKIVKELNLVPDKEDILAIYTFGSETPKETYSPSVEVTFITKRNIEKTIRANTVQHITERVPVPKFNTPGSVDIIADDGSLGEGIDILIGNDNYFSFIRNEHIHLCDNLYLIDTDFGWIISGSTTVKDHNTLSVITYCQCHNTECPYFTEPDLPLRNIDMKFLWSLESIGISDSPKATQQEEAVKHFNQTVKYRDGRYYVKWPWVQFPPDIPTNFGLAYGRLKGLLQRLNEDNFKEYEEILKEQLNAGIIEIVDPQPLSIQQRNPPVHYLPHHMVKQANKRGRIVYDASAKVKESKSLNEAMYKGPSMLEDLTGLILQFRTGKIGLISDVEKAFLQVGLQQEDRDVTRFLWLKDPHREPSEENLLHLRFCRVPFGIISSLFLLTATIRYHLSNNNEELLQKVADKCYVDNLVTNSESVEEATHLYKEIRKAFNEISMNIRDWASNSQEFMKAIPEEHKLIHGESVKLLGLMWNLTDDTLTLNMNEDIIETNSDVRITKRYVLKILARLYDPCGFAAPLVVPAKLLFQELCTRKLKWDDAIPEDKLQAWDNVKESLQAAKDVKIPRYVGDTKAKKEETHYDLHCFTDASKNSYAAVVYLVAYSYGRAKTSFVMSKVRVTPVEDKDDLKIPRLELLGYLIGSRLLKYVKNSLPLIIENQYLWTDSLIVLSWIRSSKLLPPFVSRRVNEIKQNSGVERCYINTHMNPADLATRPELWKQKRNLWFEGPEFLTKDKSNWPEMHTSEEGSFLSAGEALDIVDGPEMVMKGYENTEEMDFQETQEQENSHEELEYMEECTFDENVPTIKRLQAQHFPDEVAGKVTHLSRNLGLYLDVVGVLRCRGRMTNTNWSYDKKYPVLIPKDTPFTNKVIERTHEENYHVGVSHTLSTIREKYWIPQGRAQVQKILKKCPQCVKHGGGPYKLPPTPDLPVERVTYSSPFTYTGVDYFGPLYVTTAHGREKRWVCLFTCLAVRAIHLEVVEDMTADECLLAVRRFVASRGLPQLIVSDNSQTFKLTSEILSSSYCTQNKIKWKFIPQLAPWHGGFYERLVALVKHCLKRTLDKHLLYDNQLKTIIKEVEMVVNTRPLTYVGADLESVLRPADFLTLGKCLTVEPSERNILQGSNIKIDLVKGWKRGQMILEEFKKMFIEQYLLSLRERYQNSHKQKRVTSDKVPEIGDIVQIKDGSKNRNNWKVGKITSLLKGGDNACRVAKVRVGDVELIRSIGHLYPLEDELPLSDSESRNARSLPQNESSCKDVRDEDVEEFCGQNARVYVQEQQNDRELPSDENADKSGSSIEDTPVIDLEIEELETSSTNVPNSTSMLEDNVTEPDGYKDKSEDVPETLELRAKRRAAVRARERIAAWTRQLFILLQ